MTPDQPESRTQEARVRRMAQRQGFRVAKSRRRDPRALDYGHIYLFDVRTFEEVGPYSSWEEAERALQEPPKMTSDAIRRARGAELVVRALAEGRRELTVPVPIAEARGLPEGQLATISGVVELWEPEFRAYGDVERLSMTVRDRTGSMTVVAVRSALDSDTVDHAFRGGSVRCSGPVGQSRPNRPLSASRAGIGGLLDLESRQRCRAEPRPAEGTRRVIQQRTTNDAGSGGCAPRPVACRCAVCV